MKTKILFMISLLCLSTFSAIGQGTITRNKPAAQKPVAPKPAAPKPATKASYEYGVLTVGNVTYRMVYVEGGTFIMGATSEQGSDALPFEKPTHQVSLSSYYIGQTEVTQALWKAVMGSNPSFFKGDNRPVEQVNWNDCQEFVRRINRLTGKVFRLPTEAEWEYAARGGRKSQGYKYSGSTYWDNVAWSDYKGSRPVATKATNELGLYDMSGNVCEWCCDWFDDYSSSAQTDPTGPATPILANERVIRGGSWCASTGEMCCRVSYRNGKEPDFINNYIGLRLVLVP